MTFIPDVEDLKNLAQDSFDEFLRNELLKEMEKAGMTMNPSLHSFCKALYTYAFSQGGLAGTRMMSSYMDDIITEAVAQRRQIERLRKDNDS